MADKKDSAEDRLVLSLRPPRVLSGLIDELEDRWGRQKSGTLFLIQILRIYISSTQASLKQIENILSASEAFLTKNKK
jgi:hypothetical protein